MTESADQRLNLYQKISAVMSDVSYLSKDDKIEFKNTKYKAISEEKVTRTVRESLIKHGLVILPIEQEHKKDGVLSTVNVKYKLVDIDTGESEILVSSGTGADTQDKGVGKAMTYSYKYLLLRTFAIPTGEDPDKISSAELDEKQRQAELITPKQVGLLKTKAYEFASLRNASPEKAYEALGIQGDITKIDQKQAEKAIQTLEEWIEKAKEKKGA